MDNEKDLVVDEPIEEAPVDEIYEDDVVYEDENYEDENYDEEYQDEPYYEDEGDMSYVEFEDEVDDFDGPATNKLNKKSIIWLALTAIFLIAAIVCGVLLAKDSAQKRAHQKELEELAKETVKVTDEPEDIPDVVVTEAPITDPIEELENIGIPIPEKEIDFASLKANKNKDIYAWIYIPDTKIDYPILQHPTDNTYYLNHNMDGSTGYPGCIYSENYNATDFSDNNVVLYGHNMKNGSMFAGVHKYEDPDYFAEHPYIYVYTDDGRLLIYYITGAYEYSDEHLLLSYDVNADYSYQTYLDKVNAVPQGRGNNFVENRELNTQMKLITLSTCISTKPDKRYLLQGVLINDEQ